MLNPETFRPRGSYVMLGTVVFICGGMTLEPLLRSAYVESLRTFGWAAAIVAIAYVWMLRPKVVLADDGIEIINPVQEFVFGWQDVEDIGTRYCLSITTEERTAYAMAAPAPSRYHARRVHPEELRGLRLPARDQLRPGDSPRSHSGVAAHMARIRYDEFMRQSLPHTVQSATRINKRALYTPLGLLLVAVLLQLVHF